jgi:hypothetical protein
MDDDKIIAFPGSHRPAAAKPAAGGAGADQAGAAKAGPARAGAGKAGAGKADADKPGAPGAPGAITAEQIKAIQLAQSGMSFVMIALKPTDGGADFFTAVHGDASELRNAQDHLSGVIERAFARKGI